MINVLLTSVGRRVELVRAFREAYLELGIQGSVIAIDIDPLAPALAVAQQAYIVPRLTEPGYVPAILDICRANPLTLVFPLIDPDITILANHRAEIEATGARLGVVPTEAALIAGDKWLTTQFFQRLGLPTPRSWLPGLINTCDVRYPLFIKPRHGSASQSTFKVTSPGELAFFCDYVPNAIIQEFLSGPEITSDVIGDVDGVVLAVVSRKRIEIRSGEVAKGVTVYDPFITMACLRIAAALPAIGPITVQCIMEGGVAYFTEINARLGGGAPLAIAAGVDFPTWILARAAGLPVSIPPLGTYQTGLYLTRFDQSFFLDQTEYRRLASHRL